MLEIIYIALQYKYFRLEQYDVLLAGVDIKYRGPFSKCGCFIFGWGLSIILSFLVASGDVGVNIFVGPFSGRS